jgi:hypothetical protein
MQHEAATMVLSRGGWWCAARLRCSVGGACKPGNGAMPGEEGALRAAHSAVLAV